MQRAGFHVERRELSPVIKMLRNTKKSTKENQFKLQMHSYPTTFLIIKKIFSEVKEKARSVLTLNFRMILTNTR